MSKLTKQQALDKIKELEKYIENIKEEEFVIIDYNVIDKELFEKYNVKPFKICKYKMRDENGKTLNNMDFYEFKKEARKRGGRLPNIQEMLLLLEAYKKKNGDNISCYDNEFLGIKELSYNEDVCYEWVDNVVPFIKSGYWSDGAGAGAFQLTVAVSASNSLSTLGGRLVKDIN